MSNEYYIETKNALLSSTFSIFTHIFRVEHLSGVLKEVQQLYLTNCLQELEKSF